MDFEKQIKQNREFMKRSFIDWKELEGHETDQKKGIPRPPVEKSYDAKHATIINLPTPETATLIEANIYKCIKNRRSHRRYTEGKISLRELSYLLYATQGITKYDPDRGITLRTVPSGGAIHSFETYLAINKVENIPPGVYRFLPLKHQLLFLFQDSEMMDKMTQACMGQDWVRHAAVVFAWSSIPYKHEWRYSIEAYKDILQETGHICQNLYLACESIAFGCCAIASYFQDVTDNYFKLDGIDEFILYVATVGKVK